ncbi:MAG: AhpC/TSA family protein [Phycisphaeraceae bacterium]|nr:AhpC/TSA family protein [Phycisphaeraceae bacterium]
MRRFLRSAAAPIAAVALTALAFAGATINHDLLDPDKEAPGLHVGDTAPDVSVMTTDGESVSLSSMYRDKPLVVTFYRGGWCPYCNKALKGWAGRFDDLTEAGGRFIAVTPEKPEDAQNTMDKADAGYRVFIDPQGDVGKAFRVQFELDASTQKKYMGYGIDLSKSNANGRWELPAPATFVIDTDGVVRYAHAEWDYRTDHRADPDEVIEAVRGLKQP